MSERVADSWIVDSYEYNGRQLKVHFDKFSTSSASTLPLTGASMSAPQSPHPQLYTGQHSQMSHAATFAHQILIQQQQRQDMLRQEQQQWQEQLHPSLSLHRANTDQSAFRTQNLSEDMTWSAVDGSADTFPNQLTRAQSDSIQQQLLHTQQMYLQANAQAQQRYDYDNQNDTSPHTLQQQHQQQQQQQQMHISMPPYRSPYAYDFSPGSPYGYDPYGTMSAMSDGGNGTDSASMSLEREVMQPGSIFETRWPDSAPPRHQSAVPPPPSSISPPSEQREPSIQTTPNMEHGSGSSSAQNSQPATQVTSPTIASPTSANSNTNSLHSHPAHPGPISLPPPPAVTAFPMPPPLSPVYHPQMSPYASPLNHPSVMMGMGMTPYGLPPITPSMPSFSFVPQPSPGPAPTSGSADLLSPSSQSHAGPSPGGSMDPQGQMAGGGFPPHLRHAHGPMLSPYAPFSPGVTMSPGALWGRPGSGGVNPYINPAVGAPVHQQTGQTGHFPPVPTRVEEPQGYFPPFLPASSSSAASRPSGLANEIVHDSASGSGSPGEDTAGPSSEPDRERREEINGLFEERKRPDSAVSEGTTTGTGTLTGTETSPRPPSSTGTSWRTDSGDPSPSQSAEVEKRMQALVIGEGNGHDGSKGLCPSAVRKTEASNTGSQPSTPSAEKAPAIVRAESDPTQGASSSVTNGVKAVNVDESSRAEAVGPCVRSASDSVASS